MIGESRGGMPQKLLHQNSGVISMRPDDYGITSNTVPPPPVPPFAVVLYKFPAESKITPPCGFFPSLFTPEKPCNTVWLHGPVVCGVNLKTNPSTWLPVPEGDAPYMLPAASKITPATRFAPSGPEKARITLPVQGPVLVGSSL